MFLYGTHTTVFICLLTTRVFVVLRLWTFVVVFLTDPSFFFNSYWLSGASPDSKHAISFNICTTDSEHFEEIYWCLFTKARSIQIKDGDEILLFNIQFFSIYFYRINKKYSDLSIHQ